MERHSSLLKNSTTQASAPMSLQDCQKLGRQPPTGIRRGHVAVLRSPSSAEVRVMVLLEIPVGRRTGASEGRGRRQGR